MSEQKNVFLTHEDLLKKFGFNILVKTQQQKEAPQSFPWVK